jgi:hypothetical protein
MGQATLVQFAVCGFEGHKLGAGYGSWCTGFVNHDMGTVGTDDGIALAGKAAYGIDVGSCSVHHKADQAAFSEEGCHGFFCPGWCLGHPRNLLHGRG